MNLDLLKKILAMSRDSANEHEQGNAKRLLQAVLDKEGISFDEFLEKVEDKEKIWITLKGKNAWERKLAVAVAVSICQTYHLRNRPIREGTGLRIQVPLDKAHLIKDYFEEIKLAWRQELKLFESAYVYKHRLYGSSDPDAEEKPCKLSRDEMDRLIGMMHNMDDVEYRKKLGEGDAN